MNASRTSSRGRQAASISPSGSSGRHVLGGMHREIDRAREQRLLDLLGEQPLAAGLRQRPVLDAVARGADRDDLDRVRATPCAAASAVAHHARLRQRQRASRACRCEDGGLRHGTSQWYARSDRAGHHRTRVQRLGRLKTNARSRHRDDLRRDRGRGGAARRGRARRNPLQHRAVADRRARSPMAAWCRRSRRARMSRRSTRIIAQAMIEANVALQLARRRRGRGRPRPDRRRDRRAHHRQGDRAGAPRSR